MAAGRSIALLVVVVGKEGERQSDAVLERRLRVARQARPARNSVLPGPTCLRLSDFDVDFNDASFSVFASGETKTIREHWNLLNSTFGESPKKTQAPSDMANSTRLGVCLARAKHSGTLTADIRGFDVHVA